MAYMEAKMGTHYEIAKGSPNSHWQRRFVQASICVSTMLPSLQQTETFTDAEERGDGASEGKNRKKMEVKERARDFKERGRRDWKRGKNPPPPLSFVIVMLSNHRDSELQPRRYTADVVGGPRKRKTKRQTKELPSPPLSSASPSSLVAPPSSPAAVGDLVACY
ncbi:hypothetical protein PIB30_023571 [Stylosanthes scabra]|uniref:Uncharacterized protein n=1 Tax=Stylosanthes scabra TaxID=79078 RepID=A0ABU6X717_9FABA|nr:hypothetical protein [Stylosanthes scabra]